MSAHQTVSWVTLRIASDTVTPESITRITGLRPSDEYHSSDHIMHNPRYATVPVNLWMLESSLPGTEPIDRHLGQLVDQLEPHQAAIGSLDLSLSFHCTIIPASYQDGISLPAVLIRRLADFSASVEVTILPSSGLGAEM